MLQRNHRRRCRPDHSARHMLARRRLQAMPLTAVVTGANQGELGDEASISQHASVLGRHLQAPLLTARCALLQQLPLAPTLDPARHRLRDCPRLCAARRHEDSADGAQRGARRCGCAEDQGRQPFSRGRCCCQLDCCECAACWSHSKGCSSRFCSSAVGTAQGAGTPSTVHCSACWFCLFQPELPA